VARAQQQRRGDRHHEVAHEQEAARRQGIEDRLLDAEVGTPDEDQRDRGPGGEAVLRFEGPLAGFGRQDGSEGIDPGNAFEADDGYLYGTTATGGISRTTGSGTVFRLRPDGSDFTTIYRFSAEISGGTVGNLLKGFDGSLYGTTSSGGQFGVGFLFALRPLVPPPPKILELTQASLGVSIRLSSTAFSTNEILRATAVTGPWQHFTNVVVQINSVTTATDSSPLQPTAFYRLRKN